MKILFRSSGYFGHSIFFANQFSDNAIIRVLKNSFFLQSKNIRPFCTFTFCYLCFFLDQNQNKKASNHVLLLRRRSNVWVSSYRLGYRGVDGTENFWRDWQSGTFTFQANSNGDLVRKALAPKLAFKVRIYPLTWQGEIGMTWDLRFCSRKAINCVFMFDTCLTVIVNGLSLYLQLVHLMAKK